jgi:hypothetical protein
MGMINRAQFSEIDAEYTYTVNPEDKIQGPSLDFLRFVVEELHRNGVPGDARVGLDVRNGVILVHDRREV